MSKDQPSLPANRAFVVQIHADAQVETGELKGKVEHMVSGQATHFATVADLAAFILDVLTVASQQKC